MQQLVRGRTVLLTGVELGEMGPAERHPEAGSSAQEPHLDDFSIFGAPVDSAVASSRDSNGKPASSGPAETESSGGPGGDQQALPTTSSPTDPQDGPKQSRQQQLGADEIVEGSITEQLEELDPEEAKRRLQQAEALKAEGNTLYGQGSFDEATEKYSQALETGAKQVETGLWCGTGACSYGAQTR